MDCIKCYHFYLDDMLFPVTPGKLTCKYSNKNKAVTLIDGGEINILKQPGLTEFSFEVDLPSFHYPYCVFENNEYKEPQYFLLRIKKIKEKNKPVYFKVLRQNYENSSTWDTYNFKCTIEAMTVTEDAKNGLDVTVNLTLKQYRSYETKVYSVEENGTITEEPTRSTDKEPPTEEQPQYYTVKEGDSLWKIASKQYGDGSRCWEIAKKNGIPNPNKISIGQVIRLD